MRKIKIGWDIGGAHIKYCVTDTQSKFILYDIIEFDFWKNFKSLKEIIYKINNEYKASKLSIRNYFTMSAEMCDCFSNRSEGVNFIINQIRKLNIKSFIFTYNGLKNIDKISIKDSENIASTNWYASALNLRNRDTIAIDLGSTTCDFIVIKNGKILNKRKSDLTGLMNNELLYTGCLRTPLYAHMNSINFKNKIYNIIPENFSTMADVYIILEKIQSKNIYSKSADGKPFTSVNCYKRVARSFGFDYSSSSRNLIKYLASIIFKHQMKLIADMLDINIKKYFSNFDTLSIIGLGIGRDCIHDISKSKALKYTSIDNILNV